MKHPNESNTLYLNIGSLMMVINKKELTKIINGENRRISEIITFKNKFI